MKETQSPMMFTDLEKLLGQNISVLKNVIGDNFKNELFGDNFYYIKDDKSSLYLNNKSFKTLSVLKDENNNIETITIHFLGIINRGFYDKLIAEYGIPNEIKVIHKRTEVSRNNLNDDNLNQSVTKNDIELIDGAFEDNPLFINWNKKSFVIQVFFKHKQGICDITFKRKDLK